MLIERWGHIHGRDCGGGGGGNSGGGSSPHFCNKCGATVPPKKLMHGVDVCARCRSGRVRRSKGKGKGKG